MISIYSIIFKDLNDQNTFSDRNFINAIIDFTSLNNVLKACNALKTLNALNALICLYMLQKFHNELAIIWFFENFKLGFFYQTFPARF